MVVHCDFFCSKHSFIDMATDLYLHTNINQDETIRGDRQYDAKQRNNSIKKSIFRSTSTHTHTLNSAASRIMCPNVIIICGAQPLNQACV